MQAPRPPGAPAAGAGEAPGQSLPRTHRLRRRGEIKRVQDRGRRFPGGALVLMLLPNALGHRRLGVTVSTRVGNSVVRSRVKRLLREVFRTRRALLPESVDVVLIARAGAKDAGLDRLAGEFEKAAAQARRAKGPPAGPTGGR